MATARPFAYNTGSEITGTEQIGDLAIAFPTNGFASTELQWWNGPDEDLGYVIAASNPGGTRPTPVPGFFASVGFFRSAEKNENSFVALANVIQNGSTAPFTTGSEARTWLNINSWNMSAITDIGLMFYNSPNFNSPVGNWNTSSVTYAAAVFRNAFQGQFNQPINNWDMSGVTDLTEMFTNCVNFNQDLSSWDVSSVTSLYQTFAGCSSFNQDLSSWNVSSVTNMNTTFSYCVVYNQPLNTWNVSSVTDMGQMFSGAKKFNQPLGSWNVCSVSNMILMFETAEEFDQNISAWTVPLIGSKPFWFDENTPVTWTEGEKPQWVFFVNNKNKD
jgi:surface protein